MLHKKFNQETYLIKYEIDSCERKSLFTFLKFLKTFKAVLKNNLQTQSPQQNKKDVLTAAAYFKVS